MKLNKLIYLSVVIVSLQYSCKKFLEVRAPKDSLVQTKIFENDDLAIAAVTGIYSQMATLGYASGSFSSISPICGLSSDEFINYNSGLTDFYNDQLTPISTNLENLYSIPYQHIYASNAVLEGLLTSNNITPPVKAQLEGEAYFVRAFDYFYLVNLFGPVPLILSTDYRVNEVAPRASVDQIYQQIVSDLKTAESLLPEAYPTTGRVRPNKSAAQALLARTYLYKQDWTNAISYASLVIAKSSTYSLVDINSVFLANSQEAIWQLMPTANTNTQEGNLFILTANPVYVSLRNAFALSGFEANDKRQSSWIKSYVNGSNTYYYPYKYKVKSSTTITEYSMVLRLAEQYLIRAEAETYGIGNGINGAISDLNVIRNRAGLSNYAGAIDPASLRSAILHERQVELFSEWGHRWFDLKRTGNATTILNIIKPQWQTTDVFYPIPQNEISRNQYITQNPGY